MPAARFEVCQWPLLDLACTPPSTNFVIFWNALVVAPLRIRFGYTFLRIWLPLRRTWTFRFTATRCSARPFANSFTHLFVHSSRSNAGTARQVPHMRGRDILVSVCLRSSPIISACCVLPCTYVHVYACVHAFTGASLLATLQPSLRFSLQCACVHPPAIFLGGTISVRSAEWRLGRLS